MPRWKKGQTEFEVSVNSNNYRGAQATIPKPIVELLGISDRMMFSIRGKKVEIKKAEKKG